MTIRSDVAKAIYADTFYKVSPEDSDLWLDLFMMADKFDPELAGILNWLRNAGTRLIKDRKWGYKLVPFIGDEGWSSEEEYKKEAVALKPYKTQMVFMLKRLGDE